MTQAMIIHLRVFKTFTTTNPLNQGCRDRVDVALDGRRVSREQELGTVVDGLSGFNRFHSPRRQRNLTNASLIVLQGTPWMFFEVNVRGLGIKIDIGGCQVSTAIEN